MKKFGMDKERDLKVVASLYGTGSVELMAGIGITFYNMLNSTGNIKPLEIIAGVAVGAGLISAFSAAKLNNKIQYTHYSDADSKSYGSVEEHGDSIKMKFF